LSGEIALNVPLQLALVAIWIVRRCREFVLAREGAGRCNEAYTSNRAQLPVWRVIRFGDDHVRLINFQMSNLDFSDFKFGVGASAGGPTLNTLHGTAGNDVFTFTATSDSPLDAREIISDFQSGSDKLDFSQFDTNSSVAGLQGFTFIGTGDFSASNNAGQLRFEYNATTDTGTLYGKTDSGDFAVDLTGVHSMTASDFIGLANAAGPVAAPVMAGAPMMDAANSGDSHDGQLANDGGNSANTGDQGSASTDDNASDNLGNDSGDDAAVELAGVPDNLHHDLSA